MSQLDLSSEYRYSNVGTLDIETSGFDGATDDLVAIGVGYYEANGDTAEVEVHTQQDYDGDEAELIRGALDWLNNREIDTLATFNGAGFDFDFLVDKRDALGAVEITDILSWPDHVDLLAERKQALGAHREWPSLEECLDAYQIPKSETTWQGKALGNTMFGEELAPEYVSALQSGDTDTLDALDAVVREYTRTDIEANIALYEYDVGREYTPSYAR